MTDELIKKIQSLLELGKGDQGRLEHILSSIKQGKSLFSSDQTYLDNLIEKYLFDKSDSSVPTTEPVKDKISTYQSEKKQETKESEKTEVEQLREEVYKMQKHQIITQELREVKKDINTVTLAAILGGLFGINGIGHFILGKTGAGIAYLVGGIAAMGILAIPTGGYGALLAWIIFLISSTISARAACKEWNEYVEENLAEPGSWDDVKNYWKNPLPRIVSEPESKPTPEPESKLAKNNEPESKKEMKKGFSRRDKTLVVLLIVFAGIGGIWAIDNFVFDINFGSIGGQFGGERELTQADKIRRDCYYDQTDGIMYSRSGYKEWCPHGQRNVLDAELTWWNPFD
ncbi:MAG: hypothetical protein ACREAK_09520 [Nitrosarchaeum sp.]